MTVVLPNVESNYMFSHPRSLLPTDRILLHDHRLKREYDTHTLENIKSYIEPDSIFSYDRLDNLSLFSGFNDVQLIKDNTQSIIFDHNKYCSLLHYHNLFHQQSIISTIKIRI